MRKPHYGHRAGDEALRQVAHYLQAAVRSDERVYRYGGEEFLLLLPDCSLEGAFVAADRIRRAVADAAIPHTGWPTTPPTVTLSGGIACRTPTSPHTVAGLLLQADERLYRAKSAGRNRIHIAATPEFELTGPRRTS